ncbi:MAG: mannose-1-phosphate guanylyltransferase/mannose-6-phosphate isomerase [Acidimicrobiia bacterium]|nr:mannose-1-phosphate guanylyltransferase/mannose-6-phosphate isomerase [Acidimicrobiia bacterium]
MIIPVILSGGAGTRLWPLSRELEPKHLVDLLGTTTLLQKTVARLEGLDDTGAPVIVGNHAHHQLVIDQLAEVGVRPAAMLLEPIGRNTAPAAAVAAMTAARNGDDPILLVLPADHMIGDVGQFHAAVEAGRKAAAGGYLVTFGIIPEGPHTGYGYIHQGEGLAFSSGFAVESFVEKPDLETAIGYLASGNYLWNSGMFMFLASRYLEELERFDPRMVHECRRALDTGEEVDEGIWLDRSAFQAINGNSIDYAVMEHTNRAVVVPLDAGWSDVGSWPALWEISHQDDHGNVAQGDVLTEGTTGSYLRSESRLVAVVGLKDVVVVETPDAVLVCHKDQAQDIKTIVERLKQANRSEAVRHSD